VISKAHRQLGTAGFVISIVALIAALGGAAYAASGGFTAKQKKEIRNIAKSVAKTGPQGPAGTPGSQGPQGAQGVAGARGEQGLQGEKGADGTNGIDGANGTNGTDGTDGESVNIIPLAAGNGTGHCEEGGSKFINGTGEGFACNGAAGSGGGGEYPDTLPSGHTETGFWQVIGEAGPLAGENAVATVSFTLPLATPPAETILINASSTAEEKVKCPGSVNAPQATPGVLCLYRFPGSVTTFESASVPNFGAIVFFEKTAKGFGSWAVKAE
jgi:Collagen triple helix repeat (20 copies)